MKVLSLKKFVLTPHNYKSAVMLIPHVLLNCNITIYYFKIKVQPDITEKDKMQLCD
jgi:hypothetical protein